MTDDEFREQCLMVAIRFVSTLETALSIYKFETRSKAGKRSKGSMTVLGPIQKIYKSPNGWCSATIMNDRYETRDPKIIEMLARARAADASVEVQYVKREKQSKRHNGKIFIDRYIQSVEIVTSTLVSKFYEPPTLPPDENPDEYMGDDTLVAGEEEMPGE